MAPELYYGSSITGNLFMNGIENVGVISPRQIRHRGGKPKGVGEKRTGIGAFRSPSDFLCA
jgi:hypothetical protein